MELDAQALPLASFWFATMQKTNGKYEKARDSYELFLNTFKPETEEDKVWVKQATIGRDGCTVAILERQKPVRSYNFKVEKGPVSSAYTDYAPVTYRHDSSLVFTSTRPGVKGKDTDNRTGELFSDFFRFEKQLDGSWQQLPNEDNFDVVNTTSNDGAGVFNATRDKFYYTSCHEVDGLCAIYVSELKAERWQTPVRLNANINAVGFSNKQPSLNGTGDTLYFVSNRLGGYGMNDIWMSVRTIREGEEWAEAVNLGPNVNTPFDDMSPCYYDRENTLFFSSNGHEGFGGLDIFLAKGNNFEEVKNMGQPFNSAQDDFYLYLGKEKGYLCSNREGGQGQDDIYSFDIESNTTMIATISKDSLEGYKSISIAGKLTMDDNTTPASEVDVALLDENGNPIKKGTTNKDGEFLFHNLPADKNYKVGLDEDKKDVANRTKMMVNDVKIKGSDKEATRKIFENIYYDFDMSDLRPEAVLVLREIINFANANPDIQIEMNANTDNIGTASYNKVLSEKRGKSAKDFLAANGLDRTKLVVNALGYDKPIASNKTPIGRQLNRRVEFYILGGSGFDANAMVYITEPNVTLDEVAKRFAMSKDEVRKLNNLKSDKLEPYKPLRVKRTAKSDHIIAPVTMQQSGVQYIVKTETGDAESGSADSNLEDIKLAEDETLYQVQPGNTITSIANEFKMTVEQVKALNNIKGNSVAAGQLLKVKKNTTEGGTAKDGTYTVKAGDTMYSIARQFGLTPKQLKDINNLESYTVYVNMILKVK
jgi:peptidoglycan-associated lipoprotein